MQSMTTTIHTDVTANDLDEIMGLDSVVTITPGHWYGVTLIHRLDLVAPEAIWSDTDVRQVKPVTDWTPIHGYSGAHQQGASAVMHPSEFIGGGMARDIIAEVKEDGGHTYAVVEVVEDDDGYPDSPIGWVLFRYEPTTTKG